jgi:Protein of unknown function (DUF3592)
MNQDNIVAVVSIAVFVVIVVIFVLKRMKLRRARSWPKEIGKVDATTLKLESTGNNQSKWVAVVSYSYNVQGSAFTGALRRQFLMKGSAEKWVGKYTTGAALTIRYDPANAKDSVLFDDDQSGVGPA